MALPRPQAALLDFENATDLGARESVGRLYGFHVCKISVLEALSPRRESRFKGISVNLYESDFEDDALLLELDESFFSDLDELSDFDELSEDFELSEEPPSALLDFESPPLLFA